MNRHDIAKAISNREGIPVSHVSRVLDSLFEVVTLSVACGEDVSLRGFGKFSPKRISEKLGTNPKTQEPLQYPATNSINFCSSPKLRKRLNKD